MNVMFSSGYRSYPTQVPYFLVDRPCKFVLHCLAKLSLAAKLSPPSVSVDSKGEVTVKGEAKLYRVVFNHAGMPSCDCQNWKEMFCFARTCWLQ